MGMIENLMGALFPGKLTGMAKKEKGSVGGGFKYLIVAGIIVLLLSILRILVQGGNVTLSAVLNVIGFVAGLIITYVVLLLFHWVATALLKGKADFGQAFFTVAVLWSAVQLLTGIVGFVLGFIPVLGAVIAGFFGLLVSLYSLYLLYLLFRALYGFDTGGGIIALIALVIIYFVVVVVVGVVVAIAMLAMGLAGAVAGAGALNLAPA